MIKNEKNFPIRISFLVLIFSLLYIFNTLHFADGKLYSSLFDDAMISLKYSQSIALGNGPYWNIGDKVEGFTNPLWTYILAFFYKISGNNLNLVPLIVQIFCSILISLNCFIFSRKAILIKNILKPKENKKHIKNFLVYLISLSPVIVYPNIYWSLMGMENALLTPIISILFCIFFFNEFIGKKNNINSFNLCLSFLLIFFGQLTRPDFFLVTLSFLVGKFVIKRSFEYWNFIKLLIISIFSTFLSATIILIWRIHFYGELVPNTYILKVKGVDFFIQILSGLGFILPMLFQYILLIIVAIFLIIKFKKSRNLLFPSLIYFLFILSYQIRVGGDPWSYWRLFTGPFVVIIFSIGCSLLLESNINSFTFTFNNKRLKIIPKMISIKIISFFILSLFFCNYWFIKNDFLYPLYLNYQYKKPFSVYTVNQNRNNINTAIRLGKILSKDSVIAVLWGGTIPYYNPQFYSVDLLGKSDKYIANLKDRGGVSWGNMITVPGHNKYDFKWSLETYNPDWIQSGRFGKDDLSKDKSFLEKYKYCSYLDGYLNKSYQCPKIGD